MSTDHSDANSPNNAISQEDIKPPQTFRNFPLDEAVIESEMIAFLVDVF
jgi:hypothetical protein